MVIVAMKKKLAWFPVVILAVLMIGAGGAKLAGVAHLHSSFAIMQLPMWFGYAIGFAEFCGGIGLLIPRLMTLAASGLAIILLGAFYFHLAYAVPSAVPAAVLMLMAIYSIYFGKVNRCPNVNSTNNK